MNQAHPAALQSFEVRTVWYPDHPAYVLARTAGQAKYLHWLDVSDLGIPYTAMRVRRCEPRTPEGFANNVRYRRTPWVKLGMRVHVAGMWGHIVGVNPSANWDVLMDGDKGLRLNCHPYSEIMYFDDTGDLIAAFNIRGESVVNP